jgi:hypothetical protein
MVVPDRPNHNHEEDRSGPIEVFGIGVRRNGEEHEDEQRGLEREGSEVSKKQKSASERARGERKNLIGKEETHARLQNRPKRLPRSKREGGIGSPENRRDTIQLIQSM